MGRKDVAEKRKDFAEKQKDVPDDGAVSFLQYEAATGDDAVLDADDEGHSAGGAMKKLKKKQKAEEKMDAAEKRKDAAERRKEGKQEEDGQQEEDGEGDDAVSFLQEDEEDAED